VRHSRDPNELFEVLGDELWALVRDDARSQFLLEGGRAVLEELLLPAVETVGLNPRPSQSFEMGAFSSRCRLMMATFSSGV
jgi:hypothetical protein